ncbi:MAG: hypothetical protein IKN72_02840 [Clostridia bacterium]|nr:hypothetical protein [Clostridia bacterium]
MKKALTILLTAVLLFTVVLPAFAAFTPTRTGSQVPVVFIAGDSEPIYDEDGNEIFKVSERLLFDAFDKSGEEESDNSELYVSIANVLLPFLIEGLLRDNWDPYFENLEKEIGDLFEKGRLDENGNAPEGTGPSLPHRQEVETARHRDKKGSKGYYDAYDYFFWYDWRLDPMETAVKLHDYIADVKAATGAEKVALGSSCLGTNVALAYLALYGPDDFNGLGLLASLSKGAEFISESISGKFHLDMDAVNRLLTDTDAIDDKFNIPPLVTASIDLLSKSGIFGTLSDSVKKTIYAKVVQGMTSAIALSTMFTMPCYWACVSEEDYDDAMLYVFGEEGSEKREQYAGLIEKIERYHNEVAVNADALLLNAAESGVNMAILVKYGFQIVPFGQSNNVVSDQYVSVKKASFGATTSTIYDTLSDDYIAARTAEGKGKYISPDRQIDASTCLLPDCTWFAKNASHALRTDPEISIMYTVITADHQYTVDDFTYTQFMVYDPETRVMSPMTEENCRTEHWTKDEMQQPVPDKKTTIYTGLMSFFKWLVALFNFVKAKLAK